MDKDKKLLVWLVIGSLALNVYTVSQLGKLRSQVAMVNSNVNSSIMSIQMGLNSVAGNITQIQKDGNWIGTTEFEPNQGDSSPKEIHLDLEWAFREIEKNANVYLLYRVKGETDWQKVTAIVKEGNSFFAPMVLSPQHRYEYQIIAEGDSLRAGEITDIPVSYYRLPPLMLQGQGTSSSGDGRVHDFHAEFSQRVPVLFDFFKVKGVRVRIQRRGQADQILPLEETINKKENFEQSVYIFKTKIDSDITSILIEVEYKDGTTDQGEIYPNDVYMQNSKFRENEKS